MVNSRLASCQRSRDDRLPFASIGSVMMSPTRMRGLSELYGSWNTACTARR